MATNKLRLINFLQEAFVSCFLHHRNDEDTDSEVIRVRLNPLNMGSKDYKFSL